MNLVQRDCCSVACMGKLYKCDCMHALNCFNLFSFVYYSTFYEKHKGKKKEMSTQPISNAFLLKTWLEKHGFDVQKTVDEYRIHGTTLDNSKYSPFNVAASNGDVRIL